MTQARNPLAKQWGDLIRAFRIGPDPKHPRFTLAQAAEAVGVRPPTWWRWEHGINTPRDHHKIAIAELFGVAPSVIFTLPGNGAGK